MVTRREFGWLTLGTLCSPALGQAARRADNSVVAGVRIGMESYSLATLPHEGVVEVLIGLMQEMGVRLCSLHEPLLQPTELVERLRLARLASAPDEVQAANEAIKQWRMTVPLDYFRDLRRKFAGAGLEIYRNAVGGLGSKSSDAEMTRACEIHRALGSTVLTTSMGHIGLQRFAPFADKYGIKVGIQGRPDRTPADPDQMARPEDFMRALGYSPRYGIELDVGDATGAGFDVMPFVEANHARVFSLNLKDRKRDGTSMPWGEGETPLKALLQTIRDRKYPIVCYLDVDYRTAPGGSRVEDVKRSLVYAKAALADRGSVSGR